MFAALALCCSLIGSQTLDDLTKLKPGKTMRVSSSAEDWRNSNVDFRPIRPGETFTLADLKGPGTIRRIWLTILPSEPGYPRLMTVRMYWDGEREPSVEAPLGDFFGVGHGMDVAYDSLPARASADGKARSCTWPMPFRKSAKIVVTNEGSEATWGFYYAVEWEQEPVAKDTPYFHASYRQSYPARPGQDHIVADIAGRGHYVGTVLSLRANSPGWWGEGDDFFYIDGEKEPPLKGTGMEDYFLEAWGVRKVSGLYSGVSVNDGGRSTGYRWHIPDPVRFQKSLRMEFEHKGVEFGREGNNSERADDMSSVAYWYQQEPHKPYPPLPAGFERLPFDFRQMIQGESVVEQAKTTGGEVKAIKANGLSKGAQLEWVAKGVGDELILPFEVKAGGEYEILLLTTNRWDSGTFEVSVDGQPAGTFDLHNGGHATYQESVLPYRRLEAGQHELGFKAVGKSSRSSGYWLGMDGFVLHQRK